MDIFNDLIHKAQDLLPGQGRALAYIPDQTAWEGRRGELILGREAAYELGGGGHPSISSIFYTEDERFVPRDEILLYGKDLYEITEDSPFLRLTFVRTDNIDEKGDEAAYAIMGNIGLHKYDVFPKGYMGRVSMMDNREQVRVSHKAVEGRLSFANVGSLYINEYKKSKHVLAVKMLFATLAGLDYKALDHIGTLSNELFRALNHALADLNMDCKKCEWKIVCDEVDGLKKLHEKQVKTDKK